MLPRLALAQVRQPFIGHEGDARRAAFTPRRIECARGTLLTTDVAPGVRERWMHHHGWRCVEPAGGRFAARGPVICRDTREAPTRSFARTIDSNAMATRVEWARLTREFVMTNRLA